MVTFSHLTHAHTHKQTQMMLDYDNILTAAEDKIHQSANVAADDVTELSEQIEKFKVS